MHEDRMLLVDVREKPHSPIIDGAKAATRETEQKIGTVVVETLSDKLADAIGTDHPPDRGPFVLNFGRS